MYCGSSPVDFADYGNWLELFAHKSVNASTHARPHQACLGPCMHASVYPCVGLSVHASVCPFPAQPCLLAPPCLSHCHMGESSPSSLLSSVYASSLSMTPPFLLAIQEAMQTLTVVSLWPWCVRELQTLQLPISRLSGRSHRCACGTAQANT